MIYRAEVVRVMGDGSVYVKVPRLTGQTPRGPYLVLEGPTTADGVGPHTHTTNVLALGDKVLVAYLEGSRDKLVVLGRYQPAG